MSDQWEWNCKIWTVTLRVWFGATEMETGDRKEKFVVGGSCKVAFVRM